MQEQVEQFQKENETFAKEKKSLEELNSTWSQKIVEQKDEIESMRKRMAEMETSLQEARQALDVKSSEVETLEGKLKTEVSRQLFNFQKHW